MRRLAPVGLAALIALAAPRAGAQQGARPSEQDMFGGPSGPAPAAPSPDGGAPEGGPPPVRVEVVPPEAPPGAPPSAAAAAATANDRDQAMLGAGEAPAHLSDYQAPENPLAIGGQLYLRSQATGLQGQRVDNWALSTPNLLDVYLDARPNPRVRAFVLGRMSFNPTALPGEAAAPASNDTGGAFAGGSPTGFTTPIAGRGPASVLDQLWVRFDIKQRVFVTAGKQHVRWGTGRFWQPTDYLHPVKRNPLDVFDARPGQAMIKLHMPWEARGWNFYAFGITEDPNQATDTLHKVAGAARAELIIFDAEIGLDALVKAGQKPRFGIDLSTGLWEFDVYADVGLRSGEDFPVVHKVDDPNAGVICAPRAGADPMAPLPVANDIAAQYAVTPLSGLKTQAVVGINWSHKYNDNDLFTIGAEYFYNQPGYSDPSIYPGLLFNQSGTPMLNFFYTGKQYASLFASFPFPYSWNLSTFTLSTLSNISDQSYISRFDFSYTLLTHLSLETFIGLHYGTAGGEFRLGFDIPDQYRVRQPVPADGSPAACDFTAGFRRDPALIDLGIALRMKI